VGAAPPTPQGAKSASNGNLNSCQTQAHATRRVPIYCSRLTALQSVSGLTSLPSMAKTWHNASHLRSKCSRHQLASAFLKHQTAKNATPRATANSMQTASHLHCTEAVNWPPQARAPNLLLRINKVSNCASLISSWLHTSCPGCCKGYSRRAPG
jgi:hypothetical protein